jgi:S1-C subfamily serine protease
MKSRMKILRFNFDVFPRRTRGIAHGLLLMSVAVVLSVTVASAASFDLGRVICDDAIEKELIRAGTEFLRSGRGTAASNIVNQPDRTAVVLKLPRPSRKKLTAEQVAAQARAGTLVVAYLHLCKSCPAYHAVSGAGIVLTEDGVIATCHHLVSDSDAKVFVAMTGDGRCFPVKELLASSHTNDVVLLRLETGGKRLTALPLEEHAPVGSRVYVLGHPESHYYMFTEGIVSRHFTGQAETGESEMLSITAEFAPGSSGCPILNERGNVVGMADNIVRAGYDSKKPHGASIVFKHCRPSTAIRGLIQPKS